MHKTLKFKAGLQSFLKVANHPHLHIIIHMGFYSYTPFLLLSHSPMLRLDLGILLLTLLDVNQEQTK